MLLKLCYLLCFLITPNTGVPHSSLNHSPQLAATSGADVPREYGDCSGPDPSLLLDEVIPQKMVLLLKRTDVHLEVTGAALHAQVEQVFFNHTAEVLQVEYTFPLPENATITGLKMELEDEIISSVVQERKQAKKTYTAATKSGRKALLLEQNRPNVFTTTINRLEPGEEVVVNFNYLQPLPFENGSYKIVFPTTFGSRYFPKNWLNRELDDENGAQIQERLSPLTVDVTENKFNLKATVLGLPIDEIQSQTHNLYLSEEGDDGLFLEIDPEDHRPDRDVVLELVLAESESPQSRLLQSVSAHGAHGLLQVFPPLGELDDMETRSKEVIFIIDTSGSMSGVPMQQAREGLQACLNMLNADDRFNIVAYDDAYQLFRSEAVDNTEANLEAGLHFASELEADGGTELQPALSTVLQMPRSAFHLPWIVLLTDGDVGNERDLLNLVHRSEYRNRIFSFGMGSAPNRYLLGKIGEVGGGFATYVAPGSDLKDVMTGFFETVLAPVLTDVTVEIYQHDGTKAAVDFLPGTPPDLYMDRPLQLCYQSASALKGYAEVSGEWKGERVTYTVPIPAAIPTFYEGIEQLFGKAKLDALMVDYFLTDAGPLRDRIRADVVKTALSYQLVSQFTSRVAVSQKRVTQPDPVMALAKVPLVQPAGRAYPSTATQDWLLLGLGCLLMAGAACLSLTRRVRTSV